MYSNIKLLSSGVAGSTTATAYTSPITKQSQIGSLIFHNSSSAITQLEVFVYGTATGNKILNVLLSESETYEFSPKVPITLESEETFSIKAGAEAAINYFIYGRTEEPIV